MHAPGREEMAGLRANPLPTVQTLPVDVFRHVLLIVIGNTSFLARSG
jgi:hypothetical protein